MVKRNYCRVQNHDKDAVERFTREYLAAMDAPADQTERARLALVRHNPSMRFTPELPPELEL